MDYIEDGAMLSESWESKRHDKEHRTNLFKDISRVILELSRIPLPRIGSFTMDDKGYVSLTKRPLTHTLRMLENDYIPTGIGREYTYTAVEPYLHDMLSCHDHRLSH